MFNIHNSFCKGELSRHLSVFVESTLHPFGVELTADRIGKKFCSATCPEDITVNNGVLGSRSEDCDEEEIDIINTGKYMTMICILTNKAM